MIYGKNRHATIIVAKNIPGYNDFVNEDFTLDFSPGEKIKIQYPPDHPDSGSYYEQASTQLDGDPFIFGIVVSDTKRKIHEEDKQIKFNKDFIQPYQSELTVAILPSFQSGFRPLSDRNLNADGGKDAFILMGSVVEGVDSKAKRFYVGPFKGFTKEIQGVCTEPKQPNLMDGGDCDGWKKGSYYESGYNPKKHDVFVYAGEPAYRVDHKNPFNKDFMRFTPYERKKYAFLNIRNRKPRPIPYDILADNDKGYSAVLLTNKHVLVSKFTDINNADLKFYSPSEGVITSTVASSVDTFKQIWDTIGFVGENRDSTTQDSFNKLSDSFSSYKIITLANELPEDTTKVQLLDLEKSNPIFYGMVLSHEGRGHVGIFCKPMDKTTYDDANGIDLSFQNPEKCGGNFRLIGTTPADDTLIPTVADKGSPVLTYFINRLVFLGFCSGIGFAERAIKSQTDIFSTDFDSFVRVHGCSIGSTKKYPMGWGVSYSSFDILNMYLESKGDTQKAVTNEVIRSKGTTSFYYPYPDIEFTKSIGGSYDGENQITDFIDFR